MLKELNRELLEWNRQGIVPGPEETREEFADRAQYCLTLKDKLQQELSQYVPFLEEEATINDSLKKAIEKSKKSYDIAPLWVPLFFSNHQMPFWQGGCAWIFQVTDSSPRAALIQLRKAFAKSDCYLSLYNKIELLTHELSHVGRLAYEEPQFEEFFAYRLSNSSFRRRFGPVIKSSGESLFFVLTLITTLLMGIALMFFEKPEWSLFPNIFPLALIFASLIRLRLRHRQLNLCQEQVNKVLGCAKKTAAVLYRLTDKEIIAFSRFEKNQILKYAQEQKHLSLRWKVINEAYFTQILK